MTKRGSTTLWTVFPLVLTRNVLLYNLHPLVLVLGFAAVQTKSKQASFQCPKISNTPPTPTPQACFLKAMVFSTHSSLKHSLSLQSIWPPSYQYASQKWCPEWATVLLRQYDEPGWNRLIPSHVLATTLPLMQSNITQALLAVTSHVIYIGPGLIKIPTPLTHWFWPITFFSIPLPLPIWIYIIERFDPSWIIYINSFKNITLSTNQSRTSRILISKRNSPSK